MENSTNPVLVPEKQSNVSMTTGHSVCPHDCPSACAVDVELLADGRVGRLRGAKENRYTAGVVCAKVARYAERLYHPDRLKQALKRKGEKGSGEWQTLSCSDALDEIAEAFQKAEARHGSETVWPYFYAGTMGLVQRDSINRLRHAKGYSGQFDTICTNMAWTGFVAGTGKLAGPDPREMGRSDLVVIWGTNAAVTQVNVMTHALSARRTRGAKIVVIDVYHNDTMAQADLALCLKPGTDGALATSVMHCLFRDGFADRDFLERFSDRPAALEDHLANKTPEWGASITGLTTQEIETFATWVGKTPRSFFRLGYGFTRSRNGTFNMHAASCIPTVTGAWQHEGGGAFHSNSGIFGLDQTMISGLDRRNPDVRDLDQSRIGSVLCGDDGDLKGGPPVTALLIQNTNPACVAPDQMRVLEGLRRDDLYTAVHEQFMTETAQLADIVLPATMFLEHDDVYKGGGHQYIVLGPKLVDGPGSCLTNHQVINELAKRLDAEHPGFGMSERDHIDWMLKASNRGTLQQLESERWLDCQPPFAEAHYVDGFAWPDRKFRFSPDWVNVPAPNRPKDGPTGPFGSIPALPDFWPVIEEADEDHPFRLVTAPARSFLNTTFNETTTSRQKEGEPAVLMNAGDVHRLGLSDGMMVRLSNKRGGCVLTLRSSDKTSPGVLIAEGLWPNAAHETGHGINVLTGADSVAPFGGAAFHDNCVSVTKLD